jgi:hypothetical protein
MKTPPVTTKTPEQIDLVFDEVFKNVAPILKAKPITAADRLAPYRKAIVKQRRRGLTWKQIAAGMSDPRIGEKVSESLLKKIFAPKTAAPKPASAPRPQVDRLILDPLTGREITPG